jgi:hypothetical protein
LKQNEINDGIHFFLKISKGHFSLSNDIHIAFLSTFKFHPEVFNSSRDFFSPSSTMINISHNEFEEYEQKLSDLENQSNNSRNENKNLTINLANAEEEIKNQSQQL